MTPAHVVACIKQVWDPEFPSVLFRIDEQKGEVIPAPGLSRVIGPFDEQAIEAALRLRDAGANVRITLLCYGPPSAEDTIRGGLAMGADEGILVVGDEMGSSAGAATATILAAAIRKLGGCDLVLTGRQAADTDAGIVGYGLGAILDFPVITLAKEVRFAEGRMEAVRVLPEHFETVRVSLPAVVTVTHELGRPRYATLKETMRSKRKPISVWSLTDLALESHHLPIHFSRERLFVPPRTHVCEFIRGQTAQELAKNLAGRLIDEGLL
jgi:electron transfer flavoprotein beta subunit